jgi:glycosyltransferase involved in cell wall biosynthesis
MTSEPDLSVIVPFYNEEESIAAMHAAIVEAVEPLGIAFEMVFVDDGSRDRTFEAATEIARSDERVRVVKFRRNYGQTPAMAAGIEQAHGRVLVTMDGDLQNDPRDIGEFLAKIDEGHDIVVGWRFNRQDKLISRKIPSRIANWLIGKVTGVPIKDNGCSLKAYRADLIKNIPLYNEMHRFIPAMASLAAPRIAQIKVRHHPRKFGQSKYGFSRIYKVFVDLVTIRSILSFSRRPATWLGIIAGVGGLAALACLVFTLWLLAADPPQTSIVFMSLAVLLGSMAIFSAFLALLSHLIYGTSATRFHPFLLMSVRASEAAAGPARSTGP